jgi:hypothetical protein
MPLPAKAGAKFLIGLKRELAESQRSIWEATIRTPASAANDPVKSPRWPALGPEFPAIDSRKSKQNARSGKYQYDRRDRRIQRQCASAAGRSWNNAQNSFPRDRLSVHLSSGDHAQSGRGTHSRVR